MRQQNAYSVFVSVTRQSAKPLVAHWSTFQRSTMVWQRQSKFSTEAKRKSRKQKEFRKIYSPTFLRNLKWADTTVGLYRMKHFPPSSKSRQGMKIITSWHCDTKHTMYRASNFTRKVY